MPGHHPHGTTVYAPPVTCRAPSPASSIGTLYDDDATSDTELDMKQSEFERFCEEKIKLRHPRPEEERADKDVLITDKARGQGGEAEQALFERILANLRAEMKRLDEEEIYERAMMKGSQIGLEYQAPTTDIDRIMRSMMSPGFTLTPSSSQHQAGLSGVPTTPTKTSPTPLPRSTAPIANGPWNNYGKKPDSLRKILPPSVAGSGLSQLTASTPGGSPSASFASTIGANADTFLTDDHGLALLSSSGTNVFSQPKFTSAVSKSAGNEDTLFNVHRSILSRDGSTFGTMFALPQGDHREGKSDDNPITLHGEKAFEFRHFLWALYALPPELQVLTTPTANLVQLISIARISNKYAFRSLETWALKAIQDYVNLKPSPILSSIPSPTHYVYKSPSQSGDSDDFTTEENTANLTRLISLAQLCGHEPLLNTMVNFLRELMSTSLHYAYLAMTLSDELGLQTLRGAAYLQVMHKAVIVKPLQMNLNLGGSSSSSSASSSGGGTSISAASNQNLIIGAMANAVAPLAALGSGIAPTALAASASPASSATSSATSSASSSFSSLSSIPHSSSPSSTGASNRISLPITPAQQIRLLSGYYRLSLTWDHVRQTPPSFDHASSCSTTWHQHGCTQAWLEFWKEKTKCDAVLSLCAADVLGRLRAILKEYERWGSAAYMHNDCRISAKKCILEVIRRVEERLSEYFEDGGFAGTGM
ncbi:hypothetical protein H1R20_g10787, partial [Candolleomyces eurysporus]